MVKQDWIDELVVKGADLYNKEEYEESDKVFAIADWLSDHKKVCGIKEVLNDALRTYKYHKSIEIGKFAKVKDEKKVSETLDELNKINNAIGIIDKI